MGHKMLRWYPVVPIGGEMGMNIAVLSYNGTVYFGFHGDVNAVPDVERMEHLVQKSFAELLRSTLPESRAGNGTARRRRRRSRRKPSERHKA